jgi:methylenetetrahydrofolate reductase (NADPH)
VIFVPTLVRRALRGWFGGAADVATSAAVRALLADPAYEVVPGAAADQASAALPDGSLVTVTCSPRGQIPATLELMGELARAGHRVVPHLAARLVADRAMVDEIAAEVARHGIDEVFVIAGDAGDAVGAYDGAIGLLGDLLPAVPHVRRVGVAGYPDGHPLLDALELRRQLLAKQELLASTGVTGWVSTQMCFDPPRIRSWLESERAAGLTLPVRLGVPGVVDRRRLIRMGTRLGVGASLRFASKQGGAIARLIAPGGYDPMHVVGAVAPDADRLGIEGLHVFTFNSVAETVAWRDAHLR